MGPVNRTISQAADLAGELEEQARPSWRATRARLNKQLRQLQRYWSNKAKEKGVLSERDLERYFGQ
jgi:hypothetical protein